MLTELFKQLNSLLLNNLFDYKFHKKTASNRSGFFMHYTFESAKLTLRWIINPALIFIL